MATGISLANKSQLLFGAAVVTILGAALAVPWFGTQSIVAESQRETMRQLADAWYRGQLSDGRIGLVGDPPPPYDPDADKPVRMSFVHAQRIDPEAEASFPAEALRHFQENPQAMEFMNVEEIDGKDVYHYARPVRVGDMRLIADPALRELARGDVSEGDGLVGVLVIERFSELAGAQLLVMRIYIVAVWLFGSLLAILMFYFILTKLILSPVRTLRETAEKIEAGDTSIRAKIHTGDEFEQLSSAFNSMLERMAESQHQLKRINETLDLRIAELAETNFALYESNRLKGEFLASVSHELRTPLNSIIGFSELLEELARSDEHADPKRRRYLDNILGSARSLLEMINDLLEMAKIEAGRIELSIETTNVADLIEGLESLMRPQAERRGVTLETRIGRNLPTVETDPGKLQQILYNFLSNAIKFSPTGETVTVAGERFVRQDQSRGVRIGVIDRGPGIPQDMQETIFEKFRQVDASHTREHQGVGLGLAICRELAEFIGASLSVVSEPGEGASFYVDVPVTHRPPEPKPLMETPAQATR